MLRPDESLEATLLADLSVERGWRLVERFAALVRESGMPDEHAAADYVAAELDELGIPYEVFEPELYLSLPRGATVAWDGREARGKPPSFAAPTPAAGLTAGAVHVPAPPVGSLLALFDDLAERGAEVAGKIVVTDGYPMPAAVRRFEGAGAVGQVYVNPGENVHWGICTPIWGTPSDDDLDSRPRTPVVAVSRPDGEALARRLQAAPATSVTLHAALEEGWYRCKLPVATIRGRSDDFLLVHGHYDSWDVGVGDNAVGDATLLELARLFHGARRRPRRSLKVAWWPGHSTGRYAGSTWFADEFALELDRRCVAAVNVDSPGCAGATAFEDVMWMAEADALCRGAIADRTGKQAVHRRPIRAGDYSFNQIGLTSFFMLLSNIPRARRDELGYYPVGGCGGNVAWHTEDDRLPIADRDVLRQDLAVYATAIARVLDADVLPFDHRAAVAEMAAAVDVYEQAAAGLVDFGVLRAELDGLSAALDDFYARLAVRRPGESAAFDEALKDLARVLVPINYARGGRFTHDPALALGVLPALADAGKVALYRDQSPERLPFLLAGLRREVNRVAHAFREAVRVACRCP
jgi:hypothetical protein